MDPALDNLHFYMGSMASFDSQSQNKENQNTQNETGDDSYDDTGDNLGPNGDTRDGLTPLTVNTKLWTPKKERGSAQTYSSPVRLVALPPKLSKRSFFQHADIKDLPSLPNTPSPPRSKKWGISPRKVWSPKRTPKRMETANAKATAAVSHNNRLRTYDTYEDYNHYFNTYYNAQQQSTRAPSSSYLQPTRYSRYSNSKPNSNGAWYNGHGSSGVSDGQIPSHGNYASNTASYYERSYDHRGDESSAMYSSTASSYGTGGGGYARFNRAPRFQSSAAESLSSAKQQLPRGMVACKYWSKGIVCRHGDQCSYSHTTKCDDIRRRVTNYKTKPCVDPGRGLKCEYSDRCNFAHPGEALRRPMPIEYFDKQYFQLLLRDCPTNRYPFGIFV